MSLPRPLTGTLTALITPFREDRSLDLEAFTRLCERVARAGSGLVPCGTTGETPTLTLEEYETLVRTAVETAAGRVPVIAGTGTSCTRTTVIQTRAARDAGADAALVVVPPYNKPPQVSLRAHFLEVAEHGGLPILLYNVPSRTGTNLLPETVLALAEAPRISAIKEASGSVVQFQAILDGAPEGFSILSGDDNMALTLVALGGHGVVSVAGNIVPALVTRLIARALEGDLHGAQPLQTALSPLFEALFLTTNPIPVKHLAGHLEICASRVRLPLTEDAVDPSMSARLLAALADARAEAPPAEEASA